MLIDLCFINYRIPLIPRFLRGESPLGGRLLRNTCNYRRFEENPPIRQNFG